jgi:hypothetical protein
VSSFVSSGLILQATGHDENLPLVGSLFKGRDEFLEQLRSVLTHKPTHIDKRTIEADGSQQPVDWVSFATAEQFLLSAQFQRGREVAVVLMDHSLIA